MFWRDFGFGRPHNWLGELQRLNGEVNRIVNNARNTAAPGYPALNAWLKDDDAIVTAEIPGIDPEKLDISVEDDTLTIAGQRLEHTPAEGERYHRHERGTGRFNRTLTLPFRVDAEKVEASYKRGILSLTLPRAEADKPRKVAVKSA